MEKPSFKEDHISQIPALQLLRNLCCGNFRNLNLNNKSDYFMKQKIKIQLMTISELKQLKESEDKVKL